MELSELIKPLGIGTYIFVLLTLISGFFRWKLKFHKTLAITVIILATIHVLTVLLSD
ncbi:MAG: hypothetical protein M1269_10240 [Chloroflexi bacterium]|nr:hypothetical protein [Chloroflexota bacterium]